MVEDFLGIFCVEDFDQAMTRRILGLRDYACLLFHRPKIPGSGATYCPNDCIRCTVVGIVTAHINTTISPDIAHLVSYALRFE